MKIVVGNWKRLEPDYSPTDLVIPAGVKVIICPGHNGEIGGEIMLARVKYTFDITYKKRTFWQWLTRKDPEISDIRVSGKDV